MKEMNEISIQSATQLNKILSFLSEDVKKKIPEIIWKKIYEKIDTHIDTKINEVSDIKEENILPETRKYLSYIFLNYLATKEEKEEYIEILKNNEEQYQGFLKKKYNTENMFRKKENLIEEENYLPIIHKKNNIFRLIFDKIKKLLGRSNR